MLSEPKLTPSILGKIPDVLKDVLADTISDSSKSSGRSILISSNSLCNRFIHTRWGIRPSQRRRHRNLFSGVRKACRDYFTHLLEQGSVTNEKGKVSFDFVVYKFDEIRGNLILGFKSRDENPFL